MGVSFPHSEIYSVNVQNGKINVLTDRDGPDYSPKVSPNGKYIAYLGFEDKVQAFQTRKVHVMNVDGSNKRVISEGLNRTISDIQWNAKSDGV